MTILALLRHLPTAWNDAGRLQGRSDPPLCLAAAPAWTLPPELAGFSWVSSPLRRAIDTARLLGVPDPVIEPRLTEMAWGQWEGRTLAELRAQLGPAMAAAEAEGLDFRPPHGETPREVRARLAPLLADIASRGMATAAVTHKGVIRAVLALATGWDMRQSPPHKLRWDAVHLFRLDPVGRPTVEQLNLPPAMP
jgi:broad specificity phosphatase PhoE